MNVLSPSKPSVLPSTIELCTSKEREKWLADMNGIFSLLLMVTFLVIRHLCFMPHFASV